MLLLGICCILGACEAESSHESDEAMTSETISYLALGDSYTIGESVDSALRWPVQLAGRMREAGVLMEDPRIIARTGWTTDELSIGMDEAEVEGEFDLVSLLIGVNNQYRGRSVEEYRVQFAALLERAIGLAGGHPARVLVLSIPDWGVMPFAEGRDRARVGREIDVFNEVQERLSREKDVRFLNVTEISRRAASDLGLVATDGLHPSGVMYGLWAEAALPVVLDMLDRADSDGRVDMEGRVR